MIQKVNGNVMNDVNGGMRFIEKHKTVYPGGKVVYGKAVELEGFDDKKNLINFATNTPDVKIGGLSADWFKDNSSKIGDDSLFTVDDNVYDSLLGQYKAKYGPYREDYLPNEDNFGIYRHPFSVSEYD